MILAHLFLFKKHPFFFDLDPSISFYDIPPFIFIPFVAIILLLFPDPFQFFYFAKGWSSECYWSPLYISSNSSPDSSFVAHYFTFSFRIFETNQPVIISCIFSYITHTYCIIRKQLAYSQDYWQFVTLKR